MPLRKAKKRKKAEPIKPYEVTALEQTFTAFMVALVACERSRMSVSMRRGASMEDDMEELEDWSFDKNDQLVVEESPPEPPQPNRWVLEPVLPRTPIVSQLPSFIKRGQRRAMKRHK